MPDFTAEKHYISRIAQDTLFTAIIPPSCPVWGAPRKMAARHKLRRAQCLEHIIEIIMRRRNEDRDFDARIGTNVRWQRNRQPIGM